MLNQHQQEEDHFSLFLLLLFSLTTGDVMESVDGERGISVVVSVVMISSISHWMLIHSFIILGFDP